MPALHPAVCPRDSDLGKHRTPDSGNGNFIHNWTVTLTNQICGVVLKKNHWGFWDICSGRLKPTSQRRPETNYSQTKLDLLAWKMREKLQVNHSAS